MTLEEIRAEVQALLEKRAEEPGVLQAGEQFVFTLEIGKATKVVRKIISDARHLTIRKFFTRERFVAAGYNKSQAYRTLKAIIHLDRNNREDVEALSVQMLSEWAPFRMALRGGCWRNIGPSTQEAIIKVLAEVGIDV